MLSICLYAELLGNIRQVNIFATLPSQQNHSTKVELSLSHEILILTHDGHYASIQLPCKVATPKAWTMPVPESQDLYFRLQVMNDAVPARSGHSTDITAPWAAKSLTCDTEIACRVCKTLLLAKSGMTWKDLPSEEWAEMMDFWHCHRPSNTGLDSTNATKGTLIAEKLKARPGIGLLDTCHLILAEYDCLNLKVGWLLNFSVWHFLENFTGVRAIRRRSVPVCHSSQWQGRRYSCPKVSIYQRSWLSVCLIYTYMTGL